MSNEWFDWYIKQLGKEKSWAMYRGRYLCPCCFMPTLLERGQFDICRICWWEDDGQDSDDADVVRRGPNQAYSLTDARNNFARYKTMYDPNARNFHQASASRPDQLLMAFQKAMRSGDDKDWNEALNIEKKLVCLDIESEKEVLREEFAEHGARWHTKENAKRIFDAARLLVVDWNLDKEKVNEIEIHHIENDEIAKVWLKERLCSEGLLYVSFGHDEVCEIASKTFLEIWTDYFYPGVEDILILHETENDIAYYCPEEMLQYGRRY